MKNLKSYFEKQSGLLWGGMIFLYSFLGLVLILLLKLPKPVNQIAFIITFIIWGLMGLPEIVTQQIVIGNKKFFGVLVRICGILCLVWGWGAALLVMLLVLSH